MTNKKKSRKWDIDDLADEILVCARVGLEAGYREIKEAAEIIGKMTRSGVYRRIDRESKRRLKK